jgi:hypothetical protein
VSYWVKAVLGLALFLAGLAAFNYSLYELMQIGTCASGGPYVSARPCPEGTFGKALLMPAGLIVGGIGIVLYGLRGRRPGATGDRGGIGAGLIGWSGLFVSTGVVALLASIGPGADPAQDAKWVGWFLFALFVPMGVLPLFGAVAARRARRKYAPRIDPVVAAMKGAAARPWAGGPQTARPATPSRPAGGDPVDRLRKLGELRDAGVLSAAEFDTAKARILAEL